MSRIIPPRKSRIRGNAGGRTGYARPCGEKSGSGWLLPDDGDMYCLFYVLYFYCTIIRNCHLSYKTAAIWSTTVPEPVLYCGSTTRICGLLQPASRAEGGPLTILVTQTSGILAAAEIMSYGVLATKTLWVVALHCMIMLDI